MVAVTKTVGPEEVRAAAACGVTDFGENRVQELQRKIEALPDLSAKWHMIGHLQTNKVSQAVHHASMIHSVDSERVGLEIERHARQARRRYPLLLEVNVSGEASKGGFSPDQVVRFVDDLARKDSVEPLSIVIEGLMTMAPFTDDEAVIRSVFRELRQIKESQAKRQERFLDLKHLSMGMTNDYRIALEEGSTMLRLGTRIFGGD